MAACPPALETAAVLLLGLFSFSNLPLRLQADHLTVAGSAT
ncbi:Regulatory protein [Pseudomonas syringae pv. cilantro]|uniref:Regulatory protein n=2 Tax=Pseudomonas syringae group TaxID=136849 RepID=A0A0N0X810_PSESX|nr:Regulatory protein [Pseudomonas syringae pv. cilantro]KPW80422.1 putative Regulatory protein [Pseudomonas syringae pv. coriandricola]RMN14628.1 putative Regulatory protein [Pseudomonas syringae pv. coriandricola]